MKALIIDDDLITRKMLSKTLEDLGHTSIQSGNGRHGWETLWENQDIRLIITDMMMPDMDGKELIQLVRGNSAFAELPIIVISGVVNPKEIESLLNLGPCRFCSKPLNSNEIKESIAILTERH